jgi:hypothetical protein
MHCINQPQKKMSKKKVIATVKKGNLKKKGTKK